MASCEPILSEDEASVVRSIRMNHWSRLERSNTYHKTVGIICVTCQLLLIVVMTVIAWVGTALSGMGAISDDQYYRIHDIGFVFMMTSGIIITGYLIVAFIISLVACVTYCMADEYVRDMNKDKSLFSFAMLIFVPVAAGLVYLIYLIFVS